LKKFLLLNNFYFLKTSFLNSSGLLPFISLKTLLKYELFVNPHSKHTSAMLFSVINNCPNQDDFGWTNGVYLAMTH